tara:strand:+ start:75078 stop:75977 length:900 start_codon:yes stop_codon:yes gene_type:complete
MKTLTIATRESILALWQANFVKDKLQALYPDLTVKLLGVSTVGDRFKDKPLQSLGGKGVFLKELQQVLLAGEADIAVHSMKDVPNDVIPGLEISVICERDDARDALVSQQYKTIEEMPAGSVVGTSSVRRTALLKAMRDDVEVKFLRGNLNTRLQKLDDGLYDAIIVSAAGLIRLGWQDRIQHSFSDDEMLPSVGQGVIGIECRSADENIKQLIGPLNHLVTQQCVLAERKFTEVLDGDCHSPIGVHAVIEAEKMLIKGCVANIDGSEVLSGELIGEIDITLGSQLAEQLIAQGARDLL